MKFPAFIESYHLAIIFIAVDVISSNRRYETIENTNIRESRQSISTKTIFDKTRSRRRDKGWFLYVHTWQPCNWRKGSRNLPLIVHRTRQRHSTSTSTSISTTISRPQARSGWASTILKFVIKFANSYCPLGSVHVAACLVCRSQASVRWLLCTTVLDFIAYLARYNPHCPSHRVASSQDRWLFDRGITVDKSIARAAIKVSPTFRERARENLNIRCKTKYWERDERYYYYFFLIHKSKYYIKYQATLCNDD